MPITPAITLTANLESILGGVFIPGSLRITLCGFGPVLPAVPGVGMIADAGIPQIAGPQVDATHPITQPLWGNDVIHPSSTFYEIAVLDENQNPIQCGNYQFTGSGTVDLSQAPQLVPPYGFSLGNLRYMPCTGSVLGVTYTAPGLVIAATYNGVLMPYGQSLPTFSYTAVGNVITLNFPTGQGDRIDAFCVI
jgi:hypothetical protein